MIRSLLLLLLLPLAANAQVIIGHGYSDGDIEKAKALVSKEKDAPTGISVGGSYTTVEIEKAKEVLAASQPKTLKLEVGEFEVIEPAANVTSPLLWIVQDDSICQRIDIKPNQPFGVWMKRRGEAAAKYHSFEAKPVGWILLIGVKQGQSITHIVKNGATEKEAPSVIDKLDVTVGTPIPPKPPEPPKPVEPTADDLLVKEFKGLLTKDRAATDGATWPMAKVWAENFITTSDLLKIKEDQPATLADLYARHKMGWQINKVPEMPFLSATRTRIDAILAEKLGRKQDSAVDVDVASKLYAKIGTALLEALK